MVVRLTLEVISRLLVGFDVKDGRLPLREALRGRREESADQKRRKEAFDEHPHW